MPYHNYIDNEFGRFHFNEQRRGQNRDIFVSTPNGTQYEFREVDNSGPIQQDQNWYHHNVPAFYNLLAAAIVETYDPKTNTFAEQVTTSIHHCEYTYG